MSWARLTPERAESLQKRAAHILIADGPNKPLAMGKVTRLDNKLLSYIDVTGEEKAVYMNGRPLLLFTEVDPLEFTFGIKAPQLPLD